jgi:hypothetical protein
MRRVSIFLAMVALIAGMAGCGGGGGDGGGSYTLTVNSTAGGVVAVNNVTIPGKTMFTYDPGTVVSLNATPDTGYHFVNWTGNVSTIGNVSAATTSITMNGNYYITANFGLEIRTWYDLDAVRNSLDGHHILMNDLDSTTLGYEELASPTANGGKGWQPIGETWNATFTGAFDGQGYEIGDLFIDYPQEEFVGLFGWVGEGGIIENVGVVSANVTGNVTGIYLVGAAALVGFSDGATVSNSYSSGAIFSIVSGGLVGINAGTVSNSYSTASVTGDQCVGGLVGWNNDPALSPGLDEEGTVSNSYATGNVTGNIAVGGLVGANAGNVSNSYSIASVTGSNMTGGLVGANAGNVSNSYSTGSVTGNNLTGGLVGDNSYGGTVSDSFWDTQTSGQFISAGGTGQNTTEMKYLTTFTDVGWDITTVANAGTRNTGCIWNIVDDVTYPFLSWEPV